MINNNPVPVLYVHSMDEVISLFRECIKTELQSFKALEVSPLDDFITENEARKLLSVSKVTLKKWRDRGTIKFYRMGSRIRYRKSDLFKSAQVE